MTSQADVLRDQLVLAVDAAGLRQMLPEDRLTDLVEELVQTALWYLPSLDEQPAWGRK